MCGRFFLSTLSEDMARFFHARTLYRAGAPSAADPHNPHNPTRARFNIAPTQQVVIVRQRAEERELACARWGLVPPWASDLSVGSRMINARSETAAGKPAFRDSVRHRRCLVPADGFYEWRKSAKAKRPMAIRRADRAPLAMAGLWERWEDPSATGTTENTIETCTVLTCAPNELMASIHDRMPVILEPEAWGRWLDPGLTDADQIAPLMAPAAEGVLEAYPVSTRVNSPTNQGPGLIEPVEDEPETLFG